MEVCSLDKILLKTNIKQISSVKHKIISQLRLTIYPSMTSTVMIVSIFLLQIMVIWVISKKLLDKDSSVRLTVRTIKGTIAILQLSMSMFTKRLSLVISKMKLRSPRARKMTKKMTGQLSRSVHMLHLKLMKSSTQLHMNTTCTRLINKTLTSGILKQRVLRSTIVLKSTMNKKRAHIHTGRRACMRGLRIPSIT